MTVASTQLHIDKLSLLNYRNFSTLKLDFSPHINILYGANGSGKTNILESISLFSPGKGLRSAKAEYLISNFDNKLLALGWSAKANLLSKGNEKELITFKNSQTNRRIISINSEKLSKQGDICKILNLVCLTPEHDNIFNESSSVRRKFFDNIVCNFFPDHNHDLFRYEHYVRERAKILQDNFHEHEWLCRIENNIAELITSICYARIAVISYLNESLTKLDQKYPKINLTLKGEFEEILASDQKSDLTYRSKETFLHNRSLDKHSKKTNSGIHKTDLEATYLTRNISGKFCSTGEQKTILLAIILAYSRCLKNITQRSPILLLDEISSHLDNSNLGKIVEEILSLESQIFITSVNKNTVFGKHNLNFINIEEITPERN